MKNLIHKSEIKNTINLQDGLGKHVVNKNTMSDAILTDDLDIKKKAKVSENNIAALDPQNNLELLLASQMMSVHNFQQRLVSYAINSQIIDTSIKYSNLVAKLSNVFIQQVNLMQKLKGAGEQKIIFEHVHIHNGAQAVVGTVNTTPNPTLQRKKSENNPMHR